MTESEEIGEIVLHFMMCSRGVASDLKKTETHSATKPQPKLHRRGRRGRRGRRKSKGRGISSSTKVLAACDDFRTEKISPRFCFSCVLCAPCDLCGEVLVAASSRCVFQVFCKSEATPRLHIIKCKTISSISSDSVISIGRIILMSP